VFVQCEYVSSGGTVIIEAENFADQASGSVTASLWIANTDYAGYSGSTAVMVPDNDVNADLTTNGPRLDFPIRLDTAGDYYIFVRGRAHSNSGGNDSVHAGIDGTAYTLSGYGLTGYTAVDNYNWRRWDTPVTIPTDGQHTFNIWMREDGMIIDQVMLSTNPNAVAEGSTAALTTSSAPAGCTGLSAPPPTSTPTNTPTNTPTPTATPTPQPNSNPSVYISVSGSGSVGGISYDDEDIIFYNGTTNTWSIYLDLSDRGLDYADVDAFTILSDGSVLLSFTDAAFNGLIQDEDFVQFVPTSTGWNTDGTFYYYFDGSDVESKYDVDAVSVLSDGRILLSTEDDETLGSTTIRHEDIAVFTPTNLGSNTSGSWGIYFDSSDTGLSQNVVGTWVTTSKIYFAVNSNISIDGLNITRSDIFACTPTDLGSSSDCTYDDTLFWDGSDYGFSGNIDALAIASP
jgi:hypothetical protein